MTKTTTRRKPATSKKTEASGSTAPDGAADIRLIPLDQLEPGPLNVRKVPASASDDAELLASIREMGIKQNLVVHALTETRFAVAAGGRRLKALKQLAEDGVIAADHPVPCLVEDERNAILTSATENLQRAAMHPADQFEAFEKMIGEGRSEDECPSSDDMGPEELISNGGSGSLRFQFMPRSPTRRYAQQSDLLVRNSWFEWWTTQHSSGQLIGSN